MKHFTFCITILLFVLLVRDGKINHESVYLSKLTCKNPRIQVILKALVFKIKSIVVVDMFNIEKKIQLTYVLFFLKLFMFLILI